MNERRYFNRRITVLKVKLKWKGRTLKSVNSTRFSNLHAQFSFLKHISAHDRAIFRDCSYTEVSFHLVVVVIDLKKQYMSTSWRWPSHEPKHVWGKRIAHLVEYITSSCTIQQATKLNSVLNKFYILKNAATLTMHYKKWNIYGVLKEITAE